MVARKCSKAEFSVWGAFDTLYHFDYDWGCEITWGVSGMFCREASAVLIDYGAAPAEEFDKMLGDAVDRRGCRVVHSQLFASDLCDMDSGEGFVMVGFFYWKVFRYDVHVFGSDREYWSQQMKTALGLIGVEGFPFQLSPLKTKRPLPIPAVDFTEPVPSIAKIFNQENRIYATPDEFFMTKFCDIFQQTRLTHTASAEAKTWLRGPNMKYWPQQLNFAVFCTMQGCGISREIFDKGRSLTPQIRTFYQFHVYFMIRRVLYQLGGIQSMSVLPGDPTFNPLNNHYDVASYNRICAEFGIYPWSDFRFKSRKKHGLGRVNGEMQLDFKYPGWMKFSDEGEKAIKGDLISYIRPDPVTQYDWFAPKTAAGLMQAGLSQISQSIEAFIYCILGAQVNVRSSILGEGGRAKEAQTEFLTLMEDAIRQTDLAKNVQRYQLAVDQAKVRLNLAVCPGAWLMPARMIINTESIVGYNNKLMQAKAGMKLGVNNDVNLGTKKAALQLMDGGPSKINLPNSHPSNPIHKAAMATQSPWPNDKQTSEKPPDKETVSEKMPQHEIHKTAVIVGVVGVVALLFMASR